MGNRISKNTNQWIHYVYCVDAHKVQSLQLTLMDNDILEQDTVQFKIPKFTTMWIHTNKILLRQQSIPKKAINSE